MKPAFLISLAALTLASCSSAQPVPKVETNFTPADAGQWNLRRLSADKPSLNFPQNGEEAGLRFASQGMDILSREVTIGNGPFEMAADVKLTGGESEDWRNKGVNIALTSAPVDTMQPTDWGVVFAPVSQGVICTALTGGARFPVQVRPGLFNLNGADMAPRFQLSMAGAGGFNYSVTWPQVALQNIQLRCHIYRDGASQLHFSLFNADGVAGPWWQGEAALPPKMREVPLRYLTIFTGREGVNVNDAAAVGTVIPKQMTGTVTRLRVRPLANDEKPQYLEPYPAAVTSPTDGWSPHPVIVKPAVLKELREKFNAPEFSGYKAVLLRNAGPEVMGKTQYGTPAQNEGLLAVLWAYLLTGDKVAYWSALVAEIDGLSDLTDKLPRRTFGFPGDIRQNLTMREFFVHNLAALALAYDAVGPELDAPRRDRIRFLLLRGVREYHSRIAAKDWWYTNNPSNTIGVANGTMGLVAVALRDEQPDLSKRTLDFALTQIRTMFRGVAPDGGCVEGPMYWQYGLSYPLLLGWALRQATGDDQKLLRMDQVKNAPAYLAVNYGGDGKMVTFNDTQPWLIGWPVVAAAGAEFNSPISNWMADEMAREYAANPTSPEQTRSSYAIPAFLYRSRRAAPSKFPGFPNVATLGSVQEGILRSDGVENTPALVTAVKGKGSDSTHHGNQDQGSFVLYADGKMVLLDPGYFEPEAQKHSLPLIGDPEKMQLAPKAECPLTESWESGILRSVAVTATAAYNGIGNQKELAGRVRRVFVQAGDQALIVLDDVVPGAAGTPITAQYQCGVPCNANGTGAVLEGAKEDVVLRTFGPSVTLSSTPRKFSKEWVFSRSGAKWSTLRGTYSAEETKPLISILSRQPKGQTASAMTVDYAGKEIIVKLPGSNPVRFQLGSNGWSAVKS